jgi:hypothetical protein
MSLHTYLRYLKQQQHNLHHATLLACDRYGCTAGQVRAIWSTLPGPVGGTWK